MVNAKSIEEIKSLLEIIGLIAGTQIGVVQIIKWLKGKPKNVEEISPREIRYTAADGRSISTTPEVHALLSNQKITSNIYNVFLNPLQDQPSVLEVRTYIEGQEKTATVVNRQDVPAIREFLNPSPTPTQPEETVKETIQYNVYLNPKRGSFDGDAKDWSFRRGDQIVVATIRDKDFLDRCVKGEYRLNYTDLLTVELLERQRVVGTEVMKPTYEILKVTNYVPGATQTKLALDS